MRSEVFYAIRGLFSQWTIVRVLPQAPEESTSNVARITFLKYILSDPVNSWKRRFRHSVSGRLSTTCANHCSVASHDATSREAN